MQFSPEDPLQARILEALAARSSSRGGTPNGGASPFPCTPNGGTTPRSNPAALNRAASFPGRLERLALLQVTAHLMKTVPRTSINLLLSRTIPYHTIP